MSKALNKTLSKSFNRTVSDTVSKEAKASMSTNISVEGLFDKNTSTVTYIVYNTNTRDAVVIDPVMDFDYSSGRVWDESARKVTEFLTSKNLELRYILETHAHADHLSGAQLLKSRFPKAQLAIGERIREVQETFKKVFNLVDLPTDGSQFDLILKDESKILAGSIEVKAFNTPGHTPACMTYQIGDCLFTGDVLFMPDSGTGRCDFPGGDARELYNSIMNVIYQFADSTKIYVGHDYQPAGRPLQFETTVGDEKSKNIHLKSNTSKEEFVNFRTGRDRTLSVPKLLLPSIQININAGKLPKADSSGGPYIKLPLQVQIG